MAKAASAKAQEQNTVTTGEWVIGSKVTKFKFLDYCDVSLIINAKTGHPMMFFRFSMLVYSEF